MAFALESSDVWGISLGAVKSHPQVRPNQQLERLAEATAPGRLYTLPVGKAHSLPSRPLQCVPLWREEVFLAGVFRLEEK